jgi:HSP20 family protein
VLTIKGEAKKEEEKEEKNYHIRERHYGSFMRTVNLPAGINSDKVDAMTENGVMTLRLPKAEEVKPKKINVKAAVNSKSS